MKLDRDRTIFCFQFVVVTTFTRPSVTSYNLYQTFFFFFLMATELNLPQPAGRHKSTGPTYKILIIGDSNVGKTSLLNRYCDNSFQGESLIATVGEDLY